MNKNANRSHIRRCRRFWSKAIELADKIIQGL